MYYNRYIMSIQDEPRKITTIRIKPSAQRLAKIGAVTAGITIGEWIEQAINEKVQREKNNG